MQSLIIFSVASIFLSYASISLFAYMIFYNDPNRIFVTHLWAVSTINSYFWLASRGKSNIDETWTESAISEHSFVICYLSIFVWVIISLAITFLAFCMKNNSFKLINNDKKDWMVWDTRKTWSKIKSFIVLNWLAWQLKASVNDIQYSCDIGRKVFSTLALTIVFDQLWLSLILRAIIIMIRVHTRIGESVCRSHEVSRL